MTSSDVKVYNKMISSNAVMTSINSAPDLDLVTALPSKVTGTLIFGAAIVGLIIALANPPSLTITPATPVFAGKSALDAKVVSCAPLSMGVVAFDTVLLFCAPINPGNPVP